MHGNDCQPSAQQYASQKQESVNSIYSETLNKKQNFNPDPAPLSRVFTYYKALQNPFNICINVPISKIYNFQIYLYDSSYN